MTDVFMIGMKKDGTITARIVKVPKTYDVMWIPRDLEIDPSFSARTVLQRPDLTRCFVRAALKRNDTPIGILPIPFYVERA